MRPRALGPALALAALLAPASARAGDPARADALFKEGRAAFDRRDFPTACARFAESQAADPATGTVLNLALCEEKLGSLLSAAAHAREVVAALPPKDDRLPLARDLVARLEKRIPLVTLTLAPGSPADTTVNDGPSGRTLSLNVTEPLDPGTHHLVIRALGRPDGHKDLTLAEKQRVAQEITVEAATPASLAAAGSAEATPGTPVKRILGYAAGGLGVAGLVTAGVTGGLLLAKKRAVDAQCPDKRCTAEGLRLKSEAEKTPLLPINTAAWVVGIAGIGAGAALILTSLGKPASKASAALVYPLALPGGGALGASGVF